MYFFPEPRVPASVYVHLPLLTLCLIHKYVMILKQTIVITKKFTYYQAIVIVIVDCLAERVSASFVDTVVVLFDGLI